MKPPAPVPLPPMVGGILNLGLPAPHAAALLRLCEAGRDQRQPTGGFRVDDGDGGAAVHPPAGP
jgi:hypothetical protein